MKIRVYYEDTDIGGIVYHANYLKFCERARSELFFNIGSSPILESGHFVASSLEAKFIKSSTIGEMLEVKTTLLQAKSASFTLEQIIYRGSEKVFSMNIKLVFLDHENRVSRFSSEAKELLERLF
ncbi:MAG: YbgC/FadM family acyl-CoA thioesterase [Helicobacteraceae bacterium]|nr:YbgC/FadM family acyl-CoA thioesterase [Helicobacteraceae bacterium]